MQEVTKNVSQANNSTLPSRIADETGTKKCAKCGSVKSLSEFSKSIRRKDGHSSYCKLCHSEYGRNQTIRKRESINHIIIPDLPNEIWRDIEEYKGYYQVSNLGRIKSLDRIISHKGHATQYIKGKLCNGKIIKAGGYVVVSLSKNNKGKWIKIHQLVAKTFIPNPENKSEIDHINAIPTDNRVENLRWATRLENANNPNTKASIAKSKLGNKCRIKLNKLDAEKVSEIRTLLSKGGKRGYMSDIARKYGVTPTTVWTIKENNIWKQN
jgi:hypothetical protein